MDARVLKILGLIAALAAVPVHATAGDGTDTSATSPATDSAGETAEAPAVTLEEMTTDARDDSSTSEETLRQEDDETTAGADMDVVRNVGYSALWGGAAGALIGLSFYFLTLTETTPWVIAQFAGGGILVGSVVGIVEAVGDSETAGPDTRALKRPDSVDYVRQRAPETIDISIFGTAF